MPKATQMLFKGDLVQSIKRGDKTHTRRIIKSRSESLQSTHGNGYCIKRNPANDWYQDRVWSMRVDGGLWNDFTHEEFMSRCPYGGSGDLIYVREATLKVDEYGYEEPIYVASENGQAILECGLAPSPDDCVEVEAYEIKQRPSIHMPRKYSRLTLKITDVRVERIQDISEEDSWAEGFEGHDDDVTGGVSGYSQFCEAWKNIYGKSWDLNEWVWVIEFEVIHKNVDLVLAEMEQTA